MAMNLKEINRQTKHSAVSYEDVKYVEIQGEIHKFVKYSFFDKEIWLFLLILLGGLIGMGSIMGVNNMFSSIMATAHDLLLNTALFITAVTVLMGTLSSLLAEYGILSLANKLLSPATRIIYRLPGVSAIAAITCFFSDNPAVLSLSDNNSFKRYFKKYQLPALCNLGTSYGMGLIVITFMIAQGFVVEPLIGFIGAIMGSIVSVAIMLAKTKKYFGDQAEEDVISYDIYEGDFNILEYREVRDVDAGRRFLEALLDGAKQGLQVGLTALPGIVVICTIILMLTFGPGSGGYEGAAYEGVPLLPKIGEWLSFILEPLFGFSSPEAIAFPLTALGAVGAAIGLVPKLVASGLIGGNDIAVFTAMGMCWSGYLSTHVAMMEALGYRELTAKAIGAHTIGGLVAGIVAHWIYILISLIG